MKNLPKKNIKNEKTRSINGLKSGDGASRQ